MTLMYRRVRTILSMQGVASGLLFIAAVFSACATHLPAEPVPGKDEPGALAIGRAVAVISGDRRRKYEPEVRFMELVNRETKERYNVEIESEDRRFILPLPPGDYELSRVQINEGPFLSMANLSADFSVGRDAVTYLGTWRFGINSPRYGRMVSLSVVSDEKDRAQSMESVTQQFPSLKGDTVVTMLPDPAEMDARLYEVMPYPRYPRYFRRHLW